MMNHFSVMHIANSKQQHSS